jgi:hypothetical protein
MFPAKRFCSSEPPRHHITRQDNGNDEEATFKLAPRRELSEWRHGFPRYHIAPHQQASRADCQAHGARADTRAVVGALQEFGNPAVFHCQGSA